MSRSDRALHMSLPLLPFRSSRKLSYQLQNHSISIDDAMRVKEIPKYMPKHQQHYSIKHVHGKKTWMMDFAFIKGEGEVIQPDEETKKTDVAPRFKNQQVILLRLHCNSRYCEANIVPSKSEQYVKPVLLMMLHSGRLDTLITDADASFNTIALNRIYQGGHVIKHIIYNMDALEKTHAFPHTLLAPIDRMTRTLRDMLFNCKRMNPAFRLTEDSLQQVLRIYNNTPHSTLTKILGFPCTPNQVLTYEVLQDELIRRLMTKNFITSSPAIAAVNIGDEVYLHQPHAFNLKRRNTVEDDQYVVQEIIGGSKYILVNTHNPSIVKVAHRADFIKPF